jgi:hypothetical protein
MFGHFTQFASAAPHSRLYSHSLVFQPHVVLSEIAQCVGATVRSPLEYQTKTSKSHGSGTDLIAGIQKTANLDIHQIFGNNSHDYDYFQKYVDPELVRLFHYYV